MKKFVALLYFFSALSFAVNAQKRTKLPCIDKEFSVVAHVVKDSLGVANIDANQINSLVNSINPIFDSICVSFKVCDIKYINNFMYDTLNKWEELKNQYHVDNRINIYFVSTRIRSGSSCSACILPFRFSWQSIAAFSFFI